MLVERADVEHQATTNGLNVAHIERLVAHDGASATGQKRIRAIVDRDVIRDAVHERRSRANIAQSAG